MNRRNYIIFVQNKIFMKITDNSNMSISKNNSIFVIVES